LFFVFLSSFSLFLFLSADESITITTYYPSPYGSYNELGTNKLAVGDSDGSGTIDAGDQPNFDGDIRLKPRTGSVTGWGAGKTGEIAYSSVQDSLYHYNGSSWVAGGAPTVSSLYSCYKTAGVATVSCSIGTHTACFMSGSKTTANDSDMYDGCTINGASGGEWTIDISCHSDDTYRCWARCLDW